MPPISSGPETVLIVDDEEPVRRTFREWLESANLGCRIVTAADAEAALVLADQETVDLAILDWNLGAGNDGLQLLEDLYLFNPDIVAILITGYAHEATPLDAMRMGVRDYLDKNQELDRETFLAAIRRQLDRIRPARRQRRLHQGLVAFRAAVDKIVPLVRSAAALSGPVPLPEAIRSLFQFLLRTTGASDGVLLVRHYDPQAEPQESCRAYDASGKLLEIEMIPFARSVAGTAVSLQKPCAMSDLQESTTSESIELQPFERGRRSLLAAPVSVALGIQVVFELFDKKGTDGSPAAFTDQDHRLASAAADFGAEMLRQALAERQTQQMLFDAVGAAVGAGESLSESLALDERPEAPPPAAVLDELRQGLSAATAAAGDPTETLRLAEAIRVLALRHGPPALRHCTRLVEDLRKLLDTVTGGEEPTTPAAESAEGRSSDR
jgi:ActR/RegA family two-component response regulator